MPPPSRNSPTQRGVSAVLIEEARILNVDMLHWTVTARTKYTHRIIQDLQVGAPYLHYNSGEGIYAMPEVGSIVKLCMPSDGSPFILCFVTTMEREGAEGIGSQADAENVETGPGSEVTFRAGRPRLQQGDIMMRGRDGNQIWLQRGGSVIIGSSGVSKRFYLPIGNVIRDMCESYQMLAGGGEISWRVHRSDEDPENEAKAILSIGARTNAQDEHDVAMLQLGGMADDVRIRVVVAPDGIDAVAETVDGEARVFDLTINESGDVELEAWGDWTQTIRGERTLEVQGNDSVTVTGSRSVSIGSDLSVEVSGSHSLQAGSSRETISGSKVIDCNSIKLGGNGASRAAVKLTPSLILYIQNHRHSVEGASTGAPLTAPMPNEYSARKVFLD